MSLLFFFSSILVVDLTEELHIVLAILSVIMSVDAHF